MASPVLNFYQPLRNQKYQLKCTVNQRLHIISAVINWCLYETKRKHAVKKTKLPMLFAL